MTQTCLHAVSICCYRSIPWNGRSLSLPLPYLGACLISSEYQLFYVFCGGEGEGESTQGMNPPRLRSSLHFSFHYSNVQFDRQSCWLADSGHESILSENILAVDKLCKIPGESDSSALSYGRLSVSRCCSTWMRCCVSVWLGSLLSFKAWLIFLGSIKQIWSLPKIASPPAKAKGNPSV